MNQHIQPVAFSAEANALLTSNNLSTVDLNLDTSHIQFFGYQDANLLTGLVGIELFDEVALLRSLAVAKTHRDLGLGSKLVEYAERYALKKGTRSFYLLTTTAEKFFAHRGYVHADRKHAPQSISTTKQFSNLCPSSSIFMTKRL